MSRRFINQRFFSSSNSRPIDVIMVFGWLHATILIFTKIKKGFEVLLIQKSRISRVIWVFFFLKIVFLSEKLGCISWQKYIYFFLDWMGLKQQIFTKWKEHGLPPLCTLIIQRMYIPNLNLYCYLQSTWKMCPKFLWILISFFSNCHQYDHFHINSFQEFCSEAPN